MRDLYTDIDPKVCAWVEELVKAGLVPPGDVICEDIANIRAEDVAKYRRCHFFCGIAGWAYALELASWPATRPVWTASLPCQPFSVAGRGKAGEDERHLWPVFYRLVRECKPSVIFGEQVPAAIAHGWLDRVFSDLEAEGFACGAVVLGAGAVGAPHIRQRIFWVADAAGAGRQPEPHEPRGSVSRDGAPELRSESRAQSSGSDRGVADAAGREELAAESGGLHAKPGRGGKRVGNTDERGCSEGQTIPGCTAASTCLSGSPGRVADSEVSERRRMRAGEPDAGRTSEVGGSGGGFWSDAEFIPCADGKCRRVEPGIPLLAHGVPARVAKLRGLGNSIVPQVAAAFVTAYLERSYCHELAATAARVRVR